MKVETGFWVDELFDGWEPDEIAEVDVMASARKFAAVLEDHLREAFWESEVVVRFERGGEGALPWALKSRIDGDEAHHEIAVIQDVFSDILIDGELWAVHKSPEELAEEHRLEREAEDAIDAAVEHFYEVIKPQMEAYDEVEA